MGFNHHVTNPFDYVLLLRWSVLPPPESTWDKRQKEGGNYHHPHVFCFDLFHSNKIEPTNPQLINNTCGVRNDIKCLSSLKIPQVMNKKEHISIHFSISSVVSVQVVYALKVYTAYIHTYNQFHI